MLKLLKNLNLNIIYKIYYENNSLQNRLPDLYNKNNYT